MGERFTRNEAVESGAGPHDQSRSTCSNRLEIDGESERSHAREGFSEAFFDRLASLEEAHFWFRSRNRLLIWALKTYFPQADSFLEIGCGTGYVLSGVAEAFPPMRIAGSDAFVEALEYVKRRVPQADLLVTDGRRVPFSGSFDVVGMFDLLEHVEQDEAVLAQARAALKPDGGIVVTVPQHPILWTSVDDYSFHKRRYTRRELVRKVEGAGFRVIMVTSFMSLLLPIMALSRLRYRLFPTEADPWDEFRISKPLNRALEKVLDMERGIIRSGGSLPAGGSLLVIATIAGGQGPVG